MLFAKLCLHGVKISFFFISSSVLRFSDRIQIICQF